MSGLRCLCVLVAIVMAFLLGLLVGQQLVIAQPAPPMTVTESAPPPISPTDGVRLSVPPLCQHPDFPTGCEVVTATMALRYVGVEVTTAELVDNHLATSRDWYHYGGKFYGPDPAVYFCGDPRSEQSYGCFSSVIRNMLVSFLDAPNRIIDAGGVSLQQLCKQYIDADIPVMIWATIGMSEPTKGRNWVLPDGSDFVWPAGEHCLLLVGYDEASYYFNDPTDGVMVAYPRAISEKRYAQMGRQALVCV